MPEFIVHSERFGGNGPGPWRFGYDAAHVRRILAGLRARYPHAGITVYRITSTADVSADFAPKGETS